jgi:uncharacterized protein YgbK (DUF1537 family)
MIGAIADDFTGGTDVAVAFRRAGLRTMVLFGVPAHDEALLAHDAVVIALKTRTVPAEEAVATSLSAAEWLLRAGSDQIFFKYCSTFDSTPSGNIGPVADALADYLDAGQTVIVPSSPEHLRTQYLGHLFVDKMLLSDSHMRYHPLTPMTDSRVAHVLASQTARSISLIAHDVVREGRDAIRARRTELDDSGVRYAVIDAITDSDLVEIGYASLNDVFVTGAAGLAGGLGVARAARSAQSRLLASPEDPAESFEGARAAVLAGSCSRRTLEQISVMQNNHPSYFLDAVETPDAMALATAALEWFETVPDDVAPLIYSSLAPEQLKVSQQILGVDVSANILETAMGLISRGLIERGVRRLITAGGETSGAVVTALGVTGGLIGDEMAPGVPWIYTTGEQPVALLLKSGNFGEPGLLAEAVAPTTDAETRA